MTAVEVHRPSAAERGPALPRAGLRAAVLYCLRVYLLARLALFALAVLARGLLPTQPLGGVPGWREPTATPGWHNAITAWEHADALWYLRIASQGYRTDDGSGAFFPLYPMLVRLLGVVTGGHWLLGAYLVSNVALLVGLVLLFRLTELEHGSLRARRTVVLACIFPTSFFFFAPYTEALFLALSVATFLAARRSRWALVALLGVAAAATRSSGVLLAPALAVEAFLQFRALAPGRARLLLLGRGWAAAAAVPLGTAAYLGYWGRWGGDWRRPFELQKSGWGKEAAWPWETVLGGFNAGRQYIGSYPGAYFTVDLLVVAVLAAAAVWVTIRMRPTYAVYTWLSLLFPMFLMWPGRPFISMPRYAVVVFPLFWALAAFEHRWRARDAVVAVCAGGMAVLALCFVTAYPIF